MFNCSLKHVCNSITKHKLSMYEPNLINSWHLYMYCLCLNLLSKETSASRMSLRPYLFISSETVKQQIPYSWFRLHNTLLLREKLGSYVLQVYFRAWYYTFTKSVCKPVTKVTVDCVTFQKCFMLSTYGLYSIILAYHYIVLKRIIILAK